MDKADGGEWVVIYETPSASDADLVRTTLEVAGYRVSVEGGGAAAGGLLDLAWSLLAAFWHS